MVVRNPTQYQLIDHALVKTAEDVLYSMSDVVVQNHEYQLLTEHLAISVTFPGFRSNVTASPVNHHMYRFYTHLIDFCDIAAITNNETSAKFTALMWSDAVATPRIRVTSTAVTNNDVEYNGAITATPTWTTFGHPAFNVLTNDQQDQIDLYIGYDPGGSSGEVWCAGFGLFIEAAI